MQQLFKNYMKHIDPKLVPHSAVIEALLLIYYLIGVMLRKINWFYDNIKNIFLNTKGNNSENKL